MEALAFEQELRRGKQPKQMVCQLIGTKEAVRSTPITSSRLNINTILRGRAFLSDSFEELRNVDFATFPSASQVKLVGPGVKGSLLTGTLQLWDVLDSEMA